VLGPGFGHRLSPESPVMLATPTRVSVPAALAAAACMHACMQKCDNDLTAHAGGSISKFLLDAVSASIR
jgi:hypothetical protein